MDVAQRKFSKKFKSNKNPKRSTMSQKRLRELAK